MALMHFRMTSRTKSSAQAPAAAHARYMLRTAEGAGEAHAAYVVRSSSSVADREDLVATGMGNLPGWAQDDPVRFFAAADTHERINGRVGTQIEAALPRELSRDQQQALVQDFVSSRLGTQHAYVWAIHETTARDGQGNPHMHLLFSERQDPGRALDPAAYFSRTGATKDRDMHDYGYLRATRQAWSDTVNLHLERAGVTARVDPRSFRDQGVAQEATARVRVQDVQRAKYHGYETHEWRQTVALRDRSGGPDPARVQQYWEARKTQLGITRGMAHTDALHRIAAPPAAPPPPQVSRTLAQAQQAVTQAQQHLHRVHGAVLLAQHQARTGQHSPAVEAAIDKTARLAKPLIGNKESRIYHEPGQKNYGDVTPKKQVYFWSIAEAEKAGYRRAANDHYGRGSEVPMPATASGQSGLSGLSTLRGSGLPTSLGIPQGEEAAVRRSKYHLDVQEEERHERSQRRGW